MVGPRDERRAWFGLLLILDGCFYAPMVDPAPATASTDSAVTTSISGPTIASTAELTTNPSIPTEPTGTGSGTTTSEGTTTATDDTAATLDTSTTTEPSACGNGALDADEECDDGDMQSNDGCDASCTRTIRSLVTGGNHTCALLASGAVRCWGYNISGQLGRGDVENIGDEPGEMPPQDVEIGGTVGQLATGINHTCALLAGGAVRCWGENQPGVLGYGHIFNIGDQAGEMPPDDVDLGAPVELLSAGFSHTCARLVGGEVRCWGANNSGQLGIGSKENLGDDPGEMPPPAAELGGVPIQLEMGSAHSCALFNGGAVRCWGNNFTGELAHDYPNDLGDTPGEMPPTNVDIGGAALQLVSDRTHRTCAILDGAVRCWGAGRHGELGNGGGLALCPQGACWDHSSCCIGDELDEMPPQGLELSAPAIHLAMGYAHSCAILLGGEVRCWGEGYSGKLGQGHTQDIGDDPGEMPPPIVDLGGEPAVQLSAGYEHSCALMRSGSVLCWGGNSVGQLGRDDNATIGDEPGEMPPPPVSLF